MSRLLQLRGPSTPNLPGAHASDHRRSLLDRWPCRWSTRTVTLSRRLNKRGSRGEYSDHSVLDLLRGTERSTNPRTVCGPLAQPPALDDQVRVRGAPTSRARSLSSRAGASVLARIAEEPVGAVLAEPAGTAGLTRRSLSAEPVEAGQPRPRSALDIGTRLALVVEGHAPVIETGRGRAALGLVPDERTEKARLTWRVVHLENGERPVARFRRSRWTGAGARPGVLCRGTEEPDLAVGARVARLALSLHTNDNPVAAGLLLRNQHSRRRRRVATTCSEVTETLGRRLRVEGPSPVVLRRSAKQLIAAVGRGVISIPYGELALGAVRVVAACQRGRGEEILAVLANGCVRAARVRIASGNKPAYRNAVHEPSNTNVNLHRRLSLLAPRGPALRVSAFSPGEPGTNSSHSCYRRVGTRPLALRY
jgi:hypothetical protein